MVRLWIRICALFLDNCPFKRSSIYSSKVEYMAIGLYNKPLHLFSLYRNNSVRSLDHGQNAAFETPGILQNAAGTQMVIAQPFSTPSQNPSSNPFLKLSHNEENVQVPRFFSLWLRVASGGAWNWGTDVGGEELTSLVPWPQSKSMPISVAVFFKGNVGGSCWESPLLHLIWPFVTLKQSKS